MRKRKPSTRFCLVKWGAGGYTIEVKANVRRWVRKWNTETFALEVLCDDQPLKVLKGMLKLFNEGTE